MTLEKQLAELQKAFRSREKELEERVFSLKLQVKKANELKPRYDSLKAEFARKYASLEETLKGERDRLKSEKDAVRQMHADETGRLMHRIEYLTNRVEENESALTKTRKKAKKLSIKMSFKKQAMTVGIYRATKLKNDLNKAMLAGMKQQVVVDKLEKKVKALEAELERVVITSESEKKAIQARRRKSESVGVGGKGVWGGGGGFIVPSTSTQSYRWSFSAALP